MTRTGHSGWNAVKLASAVLFAFSLCFAGLFVATLMGIYRTSWPAWQFLNAEPKWPTGAQILFHCALWLCVYLLASKRVNDSSHSI